MHFGTSFMNFCFSKNKNDKGSQDNAVPKYKRDLVHKLKILKQEFTSLQPQGGHCRLEVSREEIFEVCLKKNTNNKLLFTKMHETCSIFTETVSNIVCIQPVSSAEIFKKNKNSLVCLLVFVCIGSYTLPSIESSEQLVGTCLTCNNPFNIIIKCLIFCGLGLAIGLL